MDAGPRGLQDPLLVTSLYQLHRKWPRGTRSLQRMLCVHVRLSQFPSERGREAGSVTAANRPPGSPSVVSVWTDTWMLGALQKQESEGEEAFFFWPAGRPGRERDAPAGERRAAPDSRVPGPNAAAAYSGGGRRLCSFLSSRPFQYLKLLSKCCMRLGRSAKAAETTKGVLFFKSASTVPSGCLCERLMNEPKLGELSINGQYLGPVSNWCGYDVI